ncbi:hypothetical protein, partial [Pseudophaeobacter sp.]|uniref:hypothetical protein n=1 Tax=Pseudophaeobacter sp. TaxID=1971739 RepID=UPI002607E3F6
IEFAFAGVSCCACAEQRCTDDQCRLEHIPNSPEYRLNQKSYTKFPAEQAPMNLCRMKAILP